MWSPNTQTRRLKLWFKIWLFKPNPSTRRSRMRLGLSSERTNWLRKQLLTILPTGTENYRRPGSISILANLSLKPWEWVMTSLEKGVARLLLPPKRPTFSLKFVSLLFKTWTPMKLTKWRNSSLRPSIRNSCFKMSLIGLRANQTQWLQSSARRKSSRNSKNARSTWISLKNIWNQISE